MMVDEVHQNVLGFTGPLPPQRFPLHYRQRLDSAFEIVDRDEEARCTLVIGLNPMPALEEIA